MPTQAERREATIGRLIDATIALLAERGYSQMTVAAVCESAKLSQGALFRHFANRNELIAAATEEICRRHMMLVEAGFAHLKGRVNRDGLLEVARALQTGARSDEHAAWHEVMVAARTNDALHELVAPALQRFEQSVLAEIGRATKTTPSARIGTVLLSLMHMFDSEAVTVAVYPNDRIEADRIEWVADVLTRELS